MQVLLIYTARKKEKRLMCGVFLFLEFRPANYVQSYSLLRLLRHERSDIFALYYPLYISFCQEVEHAYRKMMIHR